LRANCEDQHQHPMGPAMSDNLPGRPMLRWPAYQPTRLGLVYASITGTTLAVLRGTLQTLRVTIALGAAYTIVELGNIVELIHDNWATFVASSPGVIITFALGMTVICAGVAVHGMALRMLSRELAALPRYRR